MSKSTGTHADDVSINAAAAYLNYTERTVRRYIASGRLPAYRLGPTQYRIRIADLDALFEPVPSAADVTDRP